MCPDKKKMVACSPRTLLLGRPVGSPLLVGHHAQWPTQAPWDHVHPLISAQPAASSASGFFRLRNPLPCSLELVPIRDASSITPVLLPSSICPSSAAFNSSLSFLINFPHAYSSASTTPSPLSSTAFFPFSASCCFPLLVLFFFLSDLFFVSRRLCTPSLPSSGTTSLSSKGRCY
jgi:hypothetical protein